MNTIFGSSAVRLCFVTTFPNSSWDLYAKEALESLPRYLPRDVKLCVGLDDDALAAPVKAVLRSGDEVSSGWQPDHREFFTRFAHRDHPTDYRLKAVVFSHKIFFLRYFFEQAVAKGFNYVVWWDADAVLTRALTMNDLNIILPGADEAVSYLGRKDWDHSECGFMAYNAKHPGAKAILDFMHYYYTSGSVFSLPQWHDSYLFDIARREQPCRNLSDGVPGNNVWAATALGAFSEHRKGFEAKRKARALTDTELFTPTKNP